MFPPCIHAGPLGTAECKDTLFLDSFGLRMHLMAEHASELGAIAQRAQHAAAGMKAVRYLPHYITPKPPPAAASGEAQAELAGHIMMPGGTNSVSSPGNATPTVAQACKARQDAHAAHAPLAAAAPSSTAVVA